MPKLDFADPALVRSVGSRYPAPYDEALAGRVVLRLGRLAGLVDFGASLVTVPPGVWSSQRHWHPADDELLWMVAGELVLVEEEARTILCAGDCAAFPKASGNGHHLINESGADAIFLAVGANKGGTVYPGIDLRHDAGEQLYRHGDGTPY